ncbi:MAG: sugar ABC transporter substrate-binding protein [Clostridia bacterium]|jgi:ABC-type sugar transport system substrate-binding protein|nr:sugar ABC transporter substrate-binding protein [Clostridia bacterium]
MKKLFLIVFAVVLALSLIACAPTATEEPAAEEPAAGESAEEPVADEPADEPKEVKTIVIAATGLHLDQFTNVLMNGYRSKAEELGIEILIANSELSLDKEAETINNFIEAGIDALIIEPVSPSATATLAEAAAARGIPVFACAIPIISDEIFASSINDPYDLGTVAGEATAPWLEENFGKDAPINCALLTFDSADAEGSESRIKGFQDQVTDYDLNFVARQDVLGDKGFQVVTDILTQNPDLDIIYSNCEVGLVAAHNAIVAAGRVGEVFAFGVDCSAQLCDMMLEEEIILVAVAQAPFEQGQYAVETMYNYIMNGTLPDEKHMKMPSILVQKSDPEGIAEFKANWEERAK